MSVNITNKKNEYDFNWYSDSIIKQGMNKTWNAIFSLIASKKINIFEKNIFFVDKLAELYEKGLALADKNDKKKRGQYYTPKDVSNLMAQFLVERKIDNLADVGCGCGNLVIECLNLLHEDSNFNLEKFIKNKHLYLFDSDNIAINIAVLRISALLGFDCSDYINIKCDDFLADSVQLPDNCSVISNPPFSIIKKIKPEWCATDAFLCAKDLYIGFMEKIIKGSKRSVIISPQSFLVGEKFHKFRQFLSKYGGEIFSFDNVPGSIFNERKKGVFNSNSSNAVRAAITVCANEQIGFHLTHLLRFKNIQRKEVLTKEFLRSKLGIGKQDFEVYHPLKTTRELEGFVLNIIKNSHTTILDLTETNPHNFNEELALYISTSSRYFTVGVKTKLKRNGYFKIYAKNLKCFTILYALINSSYCYMWWRFFDGGILFPKSVLLKTPIKNEFFNLNYELSSVVRKMILNEQNHLVYKKNAGKLQESVKFPKQYINALNNILFSEYTNYLYLVHSNYEVITDSVSNENNN